MKNTFRSRASITASLALAFIAGTLVSGRFLQGSVAETSSCLSSAINTYLQQQNSLVQEHGKVIQSIVENLQSTVVANKGSTMENDFAHIGPLLENEDRSYAQKVTALSQNYQVAQRKCQTSPVRVPASSFSSTSSSQSANDNISSSSSLRPAAPLHDELSSASDTSSSRNDQSESSKALHSSSTTSVSTISSVASTSSSSFSDGSENTAMPSLNFLTKVPSIRGDGTSVVIAHVSASQAQSTNTLSLVPSGALPENFSSSRTGKFHTTNGMIVTLAPEHANAWQLIDASRDGNSSDITRIDQEKSSALMTKANDEVLRSGYRISDFVSIMNKASIEGIAGYGQSTVDDVLNDRANRSAAVPHLEYLVQESDPTGATTLAGKVSAHDLRTTENIVFIGSDVIHDVYTKKMLTTDQAANSFGTVVVPTAEIYQDGTFRAALYGSVAQGVWMINTGIDGDPTTITESDVYGSILLNRGANAVLLHDVPESTKEEEQKSAVMTAAPLLTLSFDSNSDRVRVFISPFFSATKLRYLLIAAPKNPEEGYRYLPVREQVNLVDVPSGSAGYRWVGVLPFQDFQKWLKSNYSEEYVFNKQISPM